MGMSIKLIKEDKYLILREDRVGEENTNNFGSKMIIIEYRNSHDIDVYFPKYDWIGKHMYYTKFKNKEIRCPYETRVQGVGYLGEGEHKVSKNGDHTKCYRTWKDMLKRCYNSEYKEKHPAYKDCKVEPYLLNFQNMAEFYESIYYEVPSERMELDKDILFKGNKVYSRETCVFVPQKINVLFVKRENNRGKNPIGVSEHNGEYRAYSNNGNGKIIYLGVHKTSKEAFQSYKKYKEHLIKKTADEYKELIPEKLYNAMYNYEVEITD